MLTILLKIPAIIIIVYAAIIILLSFDTPQRCLMFLHWVQFPFKPKFDMPEYYGFGRHAGRNIKIQTSDNITIGGWHFLPKAYYQQYQLRTQPTVDEIKFDEGFKDYDTIVYFHGNALNRAGPWRVDFYKQLYSRFDVNIIAIDYRGYGDSESTPSEWGLELDAKATINWLNERGVTNDRITLIGHSLGTGVATSLANEMSLSNTPPKSLILQAGYSSMTTLVFEYNILPFVPILSPIKRFPMIEKWLLSKLNHQFNSVSKIKNIQCPILIMFGTGDLEIPIMNSHQLFQEAVQEQEVIQETISNEVKLYKSTSQYQQPIWMVELFYGDHNNVAYFDYTYEAIKDFI